MNSQPTTSPRVLAASFGMVMFFVTAMFGIIASVDPFVIATRAICSAIVTGLAARIVLMILDATLKNQRH